MMFFKVIALIPARGGSKRLANKNLLNLYGHPLIAWTINQAKQSAPISSTILSSDSAEIIDVAEHYGAEVPFKRPDKLASDTATTDAVILHAIDELGLGDDDVVILLQPTSPLRLTEDIEQAFTLFLEKKADGVVSVCRCEHSPVWTGILPSDLCLENFLAHESQKKRSQDLPTFFRLNGSIFIFRVGALKGENGIHYSANVYGFEMPPERSIDIDTELDLIFCESLLQNKRVRLNKPDALVKG